MAEFKIMPDEVPLDGFLNIVGDKNFPLGMHTTDQETQGDQSLGGTPESGTSDPTKTDRY